MARTRKKTKRSKRSREWRCKKGKNKFMEMTSIMVKLKQVAKK